MVSFFKKIYLWLRWVFLAGQRLSLVVASRGYPLAVVCGLLIALASLAVERGVQAHRLQ